MFDENDELYGWIKPENNPAIQMRSQADAALAAGRSVVWHAQTEKGYRGLKKISGRPEVARTLSRRLRSELSGGLR